MTLYLGIALVLFVLAFLRLIGVIGVRYEQGLALCLTIVAFLAAVLRWETGTDWDAYILAFRSMTSFEVAHAQSWWGPGYAYTAAVVNSWQGGYSVFLLCIGALLFGAKYWFLIRSCAAPLVAIFVLFCVNFYDIFFVRESVAIVFFWGFAYYYFHDSKWAALACAVLAVAFHYSALLPLGVAVFLGKFQWKKIAWLILGLALAAYIVYTFVDYDKLWAAKLASTYIGTDYVEEKDSLLSTTLRAYLKLSFLVAVIVGGYIAFAGDKQEEGAPWRRFCLTCASGIVAAAALLLPLSQIFARVPTYTAPLLAVVLSGYRFRFRQISVASTAYLAVLTLLFVQLGVLFSAYAEYYYPFHTILY